ncbi:hypothetical protein Pelo_11123 [Pelomyxa schiedti]|nr:hypothetical protein Pelo_11123 [Pelomyxa schiedti]
MEGEAEQLVRRSIRCNEERIQDLERELMELRRSIAEREKELACHSLLSKLFTSAMDAPMHRQEESSESSDEEALLFLKQITDILPSSWQYPDICCAKLEWGKHAITTENFQESKWQQSADIWVTSPTHNGAPKLRVKRTKCGRIQIFYTEERPAVYPLTSKHTITQLQTQPNTPEATSTPTNTQPEESETALHPEPREDSSVHLSPFMPEEQNLLNIVAERVGNYLTQLANQHQSDSISNSTEPSVTSSTDSESNCLPCPCNFFQKLTAVALHQAKTNAKKGRGSRNL